MALLLILGAGAASLAAWVAFGAPFVMLPAGVACVVWMTAAGSALHFWRTQPTGMLQFDGQDWTWTPALPTRLSLALSGPPEVVLDLQSHLWVRIVPVGHPPVWLWLEQSRQPERWMDMRRAVYSRARPGAGNADPTARQSAAGRES